MAPSNENGGTVGNGYGEKFDLSTRLAVKKSPKAFSSYAVSLIDLPRGSVFAPLVGITSGIKAYSTVQTGRDSHIELNSDLLFCNHSCVPTIEFDMQKLEVRVARDRDLRKGDALTFWYPSSEWDMAQPFDCTCRTLSGESLCRGWIAGAGQMDEEIVRQYWLNAHIEELLKENKAKKNGVVANGHENGVITSNGHANGKR